MATDHLAEAAQSLGGPWDAWDFKRSGSYLHRGIISTMTGFETSAIAILREDILASGHDDWVSMAEVRSYISRGRLANPASERQQLMLHTIRSLLEDGLVEVGDIPAPGDPGFHVWPGTLDEVMAGLRERIVERYDDPDSWDYSTWLNLTADGERASAAVVEKRSAQND